MTQDNFSYHFTPAGFISNFTPLVVILYGNEKVDLNDFEYKMWNVLQVCAFKKVESELLKELIINISETHECEEYIFMYGDTAEADLSGIIAEKNIYEANTLKLKNRKNLKKVLDEFERIAPEL
ncbi:MAG TPA: hypothetical protein EYG70_07140 [Sulfurimonas sp.]|nr:hypothetical protein [Sulfurimonas sp.]